MQPSSNHCDYCGSLHQDAFMERLEAGTISISGTDKNYKVYVENKSIQMGIDCTFYPSL
jgi:hypothetical protein